MRRTLTFIVFVAIVQPIRADRATPDAPLHAVRFVDRNEGWACGSDGVILHTIDGGATWEQQLASTRARLQSLQFLTPYTGFAVGRDDVQNAGVVFATKDGGLTWAKLATGTLPGLQSATFTDDKNGIAIGDGTDRTPGGFYRTANGGQTWQVIPGQRGATWLAAAPRDRETLLVAGGWGRLGTLRGNEFTAADVDALGDRDVRAIATSGDRAVAVGQRGLVLISRDSSGGRYGFAELGLPPDIRSSCDFSGVAMVGSHVWVVGRPGSVIFHSPDNGLTWETQSTGQTLPLNAVHFIDTSHGWAVGELGTILSTKDGGKNWTIPRRGGQRAAILCVHATGKGVPLDLAASLGGDAGYLVTSTAVTTSDSFARSVDPFRLQTAMRRSGGAAAEVCSGLPMPNHWQSADRVALIVHLDAINGNRTVDNLTRQLIVAIRTWQPEVIVTDFAGSPIESLIVETIQPAFKMAAEQGRFVELKLPPWQAKKLYTLWDGPGQAHTTVPVGEHSRILRDTPREYAGRFRGLVSDEPLPKQRGLRMLSTVLPAHQTGLMEGIHLAPGGTARREAPDESALAPDPTEQPLRELRTLQALMQPGTLPTGDPGTVLARIGPILDRLPPDRAATNAFALADSFAKAGNWPMAREAYGLVAERFPKEPVAVEACRWLMRYHSSSEARRRHELGQFVKLTQADFRAASDLPTKDKPFRSGIKTLADGSTVTDQTLIADPAGARRWYQAALDLEPKFTAMGPLVADDPGVRFCLHAAKRQLGDVAAAKPWMRAFLAEQAGTPGVDPWRDVAKMELWLTDRNGLPPRPTAACRRTNGRPLLDGKLDDACWTDAVPIALKPTLGPEYATKAWFSYDDEFLYFAVECTHPAGTEKPTVEKRTRDASLAAFDRVELLLDIDRDYQTAYRFCIDQRGALAEDCWGDSTWNPRWYVAFASTPEGYTAEIAIHLMDLTGDVLPPGRAWAANVVRVLPGRGVGGWSTPADVVPRPEGCGVVVFTGGAGKN